jgi:hypothetical protein
VALCRERAVSLSLFLMCCFGQVIEDMSIEVNVPALAMEEVNSLHIFTSTFNLLLI